MWYNIGRPLAVFGVFRNSRFRRSHIFSFPLVLTWINLFPVSSLSFLLASH